MEPSFGPDLSERERLERDARHLAAIVESSDDAIVSKDSRRDDPVVEPRRGAALRLHRGRDRRQVDPR